MKPEIKKNISGLPDASALKNYRNSRGSEATGHRCKKGFIRATEVTGRQKKKTFRGPDGRRAATESVVSRYSDWGDTSSKTWNHAES